MSEFKGKAGTIYVERTKDQDSRGEYPFDVWFEDFCILGTGSSDIEALRDAKRHAEDIVQLISNAIVRTLDPDVADAVDRADGTVSTTAGTGD